MDWFHIKRINCHEDCLTLVIQKIRQVV